jgi:hypothetical protein
MIGSDGIGDTTHWTTSRIREAEHACRARVTEPPREHVRVDLAAPIQSAVPSPSATTTAMTAARWRMGAR